MKMARMSPLNFIILLLTLHSVSVSPTAGQPSAEPSAIRVEATQLLGSGDASEGGKRFQADAEYVTKTVTGFLDFVTTVGNTVMVFTPQAGTEKAPESTLVVTPLVTSPVIAFEAKPTIGIEGLFEGFKRPELSTASPHIESSFAGPVNIESIRPSSVSKNSFNPSREAQSDPSRNDKRLAESLEVASPANLTPLLSETITRVASTTLRSNFVGEGRQAGLVTGTGGTLISNGITTVHTTRVYGTYLNTGGSDNYAQIVQSTAKVFEEDIMPSSVVRQGSVQHVTERPSFGIQSAEGSSQSGPGIKRPSSESVGNNGVGSVKVLEDAGKVGKLTAKTKVVASKKKSAINDFKARLKSRFQKFRDHQNRSVRAKPSEHGSASQKTPKAAADLQERESPFRLGRSNRFRSRFSERKTTETTKKPEQTTVSSKEAREFRLNKSRFRPRGRRPGPSQQSNEDLLGQPSTLLSSSPRNKEFGNRRQTSPKERKVTPQEPEARDEDKAQPTSSAAESFKPSRPSFSAKPAAEAKKPKVTFKKFNRFKRPDIRKSLLRKILNKGKGVNTLSLAEQQRKEKEKLSEVKQEKEKQVEQNESKDVEEATPVDVNDLKPSVNGLQTTLEASTVYPTGEPSSYLEVATIRSPYSFNLDDEGNKKSTRFVTVTRTFSSSVAIQSSKATSVVEQEIQPTKTSKPLFQTETIPAPENILTSSYLETSDGFGISPSIETLPAVILASSSNLGSLQTPLLKTITETFSTKELMLKTSILPIVVGGKTALHTLTQSYYVTRLVEAVKTLPALEAYEFIPTKAFTDLNNILEEAGSEKREQLLPGELEFSDQDEFRLDGPHEIRVKPPPGFAEDLALVGSKFDPADKMEKTNNPDIVELKSSQTNEPPVLQSSFGQIQSAFNPFGFLQLGGAAGAANTPGLPANLFSSLTPDQLRQLALIQYLQNPFALAALQQQLPQQQLQPQQKQQVIITKSTPVFRTETVYATSTIPLFLGAKKFFTTLTQSIGLTTITDYKTETQTAAAAAALPTAAGFGGAQQPFTVTTEAVVKDTVVPTTIYKEIQITLRNMPLRTTLTSTSMVSTQVTSYVTKTVKSSVAPTINPFVGGTGGAQAAGFNPLAALLG